MQKLTESLQNDQREKFHQKDSSNVWLAGFIRGVS